MYPQRGQRISSSTRFRTSPVFSGFRRVWHCGHRTARNSSASLLPKYAPILNRTNNNRTMKIQIKLKIRNGIFKLAPSAKSNRYHSLIHQQFDILPQLKQGILLMEPLRFCGRIVLSSKVAQAVMRLTPSPETVDAPTAGPTSP